jgi:hypothetical protein
VHYIDSGRRDPDQALGSWLVQVAQDPSVVELRWQTGFFSVDGLGHIVPLMSRLKDADRVTRLLLGSNDGVTRRADIEVLLDIAGWPRQGLDIGIVSYGNSYYHPKTVHLKRDDGSMTAYVGSANLTKSGVSALHVEAGIILDTKDGDDPEVLSRIGEAVDWWFEASRNGLFQLTGPDDLDTLVATKVLGMPRAPSPRSANDGEKTRSELPKLAPLIDVPPIASKEDASQTGSDSAEPVKDDAEPAEADESTLPAVVTVDEEWSKFLSASDAQRKAVGHQRGSITLVKGRYSIDAQTYFRWDFFATAPWVEEQTRTGESRESAQVSMLVDIGGVNIGAQDIKITHALNRESGQGNYTTLIHLGPLAPYFIAQNMIGRRISITRRNDGTFSLTID